MDTQTLIETTDQIAERVSDRTERDSQIATLEAQWAEYLRITHAPSFNSTQGALLYRHAWEVGHSGGYTDIETSYIDLASLVADVIAAA